MKGKFRLTLQVPCTCLSHTDLLTVYTTDAQHEVCVTCVTVSTYQGKDWSYKSEFTNGWLSKKCTPKDKMLESEKVGGLFSAYVAACLSLRLFPVHATLLWTPCEGGLPRETPFWKKTFPK